MSGSYLGQCQFLSLQQFLCRDQVLRGRFVLAVLCNVKQDSQSRRSPCRWARCLPARGMCPSPVVTRLS